MVAVLAIIPAILWVTPRYGAEGAAWVWLCLNISYLLIGVHFMYRKILNHEKLSWFKNYLIQPIGAAMLMDLIANKLIQLELMQKSGQLLALLGISVSVLMIGGLAAPCIRRRIFALASRFISLVNMRSL